MPLCVAMRSDAIGSGMLPGHLIVHHTKRPHGLPGSMESVWVRHVSGKNSVIGFKMYEQGRTSFEGTGKHVVWCDEEPPQDCYVEMLYRTITTKGIVLDPVPRDESTLARHRSVRDYP